MSVIQRIRLSIHPNSQRKTNDQPQFPGLCVAQRLSALPCAVAIRGGGRIIANQENESARPCSWKPKGVRPLPRREEEGVIDVDILAKIRQMRFRNGMSLREVAGDLSRNTIRTWLRQPFNNWLRSKGSRNKPVSPMYCAASVSGWYFWRAAVAQGNRD